MTKEEFVKLVKNMRTAQKTYFRTEPNTLQKSQALQRSRTLEKEVDAAIDEEDKDAAAQLQPSLF